MSSRRPETMAKRARELAVKERRDRKPLSEIKLMREDPAEVDRLAEEIKTKYMRIFGV